MEVMEAIDINMKYFIDDEEVDIKTLKKVYDNLEICPFDGGEYENLVVNQVTDDEIHFTVIRQTTFE